MDVEVVKKELIQQYPGVNIKENADNNGVVTEIVGEIDRTLVGSEIDVAVVVADRSAEHFHKVTREDYEVIKGWLRVYLNGKPTELKEGEKITVKPGMHHRVEGEETWFFCYSVPDWTADDFYLVDINTKKSEPTA